MGVWSTEYGVPVGSWCQVVCRGDALLLPGHVFVAWGARAQVGCEVGKDSVDRADLEQGQAASMYYVHRYSEGYRHNTSVALQKAGQRSVEGLVGGEA